MLSGDEIEIDVAGGRMAIGPGEAATPRMIDRPADGDVGSAEWSIAPDGLFRCKLLPSRRLLGQKRCWNCRKGWRRKWRLRVAGERLAPPLVTENRVFFGALDNRVYSVKRKNGHRVWQTDMPGRISKPLRLWKRSVGSESTELELLVLIPDSATSIVVLDAATGSRVATYELADDGGLLVGSPVVTSDGKIVTARQRYTAEEASLLVFDLVAPAGISAPLSGSGQR
jgi:hypothetical protein